MTKLQKCLAALDAFLTRKDGRTVNQHAEQTRMTGAEFSGDSNRQGDRSYYLSDGGYSRIGWNFATGRIFLTSNSLEKTAAMWGFAKELIADVEDAIRTELIELGWQFDTDGSPL